MSVLIIRDLIAREDFNEKLMSAIHPNPSTYSNVRTLDKGMVSWRGKM
jgi:hypothetical protein